MNIRLLVSALLFAIVPQERTLAMDADSLEDAPAAINTRQVFVKFSSISKTITCEVDLETATVSTLKNKILEKFRFPIEHLGLTYSAKVLDNDNILLSELGIGKDSTIHQYYRWCTYKIPSTSG